MSHTELFFFFFSGQHITTATDRLIFIINLPITYLPINETLERVVKRKVLRDILLKLLRGA